MKMIRSPKTALALMGLVYPLALSSLFFAPRALAQSGTAGVRLEAGIAREDVDGDLKSAMTIYQKIADDRSAPRDVRSKALLRLAGCDEKLGNQARQIYEQLVRDFADQPAATEARVRLATLRQADLAVPSTMTVRKIELPFRVGASDGHRAMRLDTAAGELTIADLAGKEKRLVFKSKPGDTLSRFWPSRDLSANVLWLRRGASYMWAVVKTDGTGYREIGGGPARGECTPDWSWDNRYVFACTGKPGSPLELVRISAADGEIQKVRTVEQSDPGDYVLNRPSPDGRFLAIGDYFASPAHYTKVRIMPSQGGTEPQLVADNARLIDWTRDGRYLIVASNSSGSEALYLLPVKDGRADGPLAFVRYGPCLAGSTNTDGALVYRSSLPEGTQALWAGSLDSARRVAGWKTLKLAGDISLNPSIRWSPDSTQILYWMADITAERKVVLRTYNTSTGEDRELYRSEYDSHCVWTSNASLFCANRPPRHDVEVFSIAVDSGRVDQLGSVEGYPAGAGVNVYFASDDGRSVYLSRGDELIRWESGSEHLLGPMLGRTAGDNLIPYPDRHWMAQRVDGTIQIRPLAGGDWKTIHSNLPMRMAFTPDGKGMLYSAADAAGKQGLYRISTEGGQPERIGGIPEGSSDLLYLWISPDGRTVIARGYISTERWVLENFEPKAPENKGPKN